jgi:hypothetical protein
VTDRGPHRRREGACDPSITVPDAGDHGSKGGDRDPGVQPTGYRDPPIAVLDGAQRDAPILRSVSPWPPNGILSCGDGDTAGCRTGHRLQLAEVPVGTRPGRSGHGQDGNGLNALGESSYSPRRGSAALDGRRRTRSLRGAVRPVHAQVASGARQPSRGGVERAEAQRLGAPPCAVRRPRERSLPAMLQGIVAHGRYAAVAAESARRDLIGR